MTHDGHPPHEWLVEHRESIDRLDAMLVYTLAERFKCTHAVGRKKLEYGLPVSDPAREAWQIKRIERLASGNGVDPAFACRIFRFILDEVVKNHHHKQNYRSTDN